jgi:hypothetical protein
VARTSSPLRRVGGEKARPLSDEKSVFMNRWLIRFFILLFLFFHLALSFHHHNHHFFQPSCSLCSFISSSSNFVPENDHEVLTPLCEIGHAPVKDQGIHPFLGRSPFPNRSPPV